MTIEKIKSRPVKTVSLSFLGTGQHREVTSHVLTSFHDTITQNNINNPTFKTRLFDGPGAVPKSSDSKDPIPGTYVYNPQTNEKVLISPLISRQVSDLMQEISGNIAGEGVEHLILEAVLYLDDIIKNNNGVLPETVNLQGFSRGADVCMRLANVLNELHPDMKVNLFLIDQVPGPGRLNDVASYTIPPNVDRFESNIMLHEFRPVFDPQHSGRYVFAAPDKTKASVRLYYGEHNEGTRVTDTETRQQTGKLLHDDLFRFCKDTGTIPHGAGKPDIIIRNEDGSKSSQPGGQGLTNAERFTLLSEMKNSEWFYAKGNKSQGLHKRSVSSKREDYVLQSDLFVNKDHRELCQELYPKVFRWFSEKNHNNKYTKDEVVDELLKLSETHNDFFQTLAEKFKFDSHNIIETLPDPQGVDREDKSRMREPIVKDRLTYLQHSLSSIANYYHYHAGDKNAAMDQASKRLMEKVKESREIPDEEATKLLEIAIENEKLYLEKQGEKGYVWHQINQISPDSALYAQKINKLLDEHVSKNPLLSVEQINDISQTILVINNVQLDGAKDSRQKYMEMRQQVINLNSRIKETTTDNQSLQNQMGQAYTYFSDSSDKDFNLTGLSRSLNQLSNAHFGETNITRNIVQKLQSYEKRNKFWSSVKDVFDVLSIPFPRMFSPEKDNIANRLRERLGELEETNDVVAISKELGKARAELVTYYKSTFKLDTGDLDKIINNAIGELGVLNSNQPEPTYDYQSKEQKTL